MRTFELEYASPFIYLCPKPSRCSAHPATMGTTLNAGIISNDNRISFCSGLDLQTGRNMVNHRQPANPLPHPFPSSSFKKLPGWSTGLRRTRTRTRTNIAISSIAGSHLIILPTSIKWGPGVQAKETELLRVEIFRGRSGSPKICGFWREKGWFCAIIQ